MKIHHSLDNEHKRMQMRFCFAQQIAVKKEFLVICMTKFVSLGLMVPLLIMDPHWLSFVRKNLATKERYSKIDILFFAIIFFRTGLLTSRKPQFLQV